MVQRGTWRLAIRRRTGNEFDTDHRRFGREREREVS
jgi:hypothetical protein